MKDGQWVGGRSRWPVGGTGPGPASWWEVGGGQACQPVGGRRGPGAPASEGCLLHLAPAHNPPPGCSAALGGMLRLLGRGAESNHTHDQQLPCSLL